jgi:hypothetical protein
MTIFAAARFPDEQRRKRERRYGIREGRIYYLDRDNRYKWETEGFWQRAKGLIGDIAANAPAEVLSALMARWGLKGAALGGAAGEWLRNLEARARFDEPQSVMEQWLKPATVGVFTGVGEKGGQAAPQLLERGYSRMKALTGGAPPGAYGAARTVVREAGDYAPMNPAAEKKMRAIFEKWGIDDPTMIETTGSNRLADIWSLLGDSPATAEAVQATNVKRMQDVQMMTDDFLQQMAPSTGPLEAGNRAAVASRKAFDAIRQRQQAATSRLYDEAFATARPVRVEPVLDLLDKALKVLPDGKTAKGVHRVRRLLLRKTKEVPKPTGLRRPQPRPAPEMHPGGEFMDEAAERAQLTRRFQPKAATVEAVSREIVGGSELPAGDRAILLGLQQSGALEAADSLTVEKALGNRTITPWEGIRLKELVAAGREAAEAPGAPIPRTETVIDLPRREPERPFPQPTGTLGAVAQPVREIPPTPAQLAAAKEITVPETRLETVQSARFELDSVIEDPDIAKLHGSQQAEIKRILTQAREALTKQMRRASGKFAEADDKWASFVPELDRFSGSAVGKIARVEGDQQTAIVNRLLQGAFVEPATVRYAREQIVSQDPGAWDAITKEYIRGFWSELRAKADDDQAANLGGRLATLLRRHSTIMNEALSHNPTLRHNYKEWLTVLNRTGLLFRRESKTEARQQMRREMSRAGRRGPVGLAAGAAQIDVTRPLARAGRWVEDTITDPRYQQRLLKTLQEPNASKALQHMKKLGPKSRSLIQNFLMFMATFTGAELPEQLERARAPDRIPQRTE